MTFKENSLKTDKVNGFLQEFNLLQEAEEFGLFFEDGIVKLEAIYTVDQITVAVKETIDLLK